MPVTRQQVKEISSLLLWKQDVCCTYYYLSHTKNFQVVFFSIPHIKHVTYYQSLMPQSVRTFHGQPRCSMLTRSFLTQIEHFWTSMKHSYWSWTLYVYIFRYAKRRVWSVLFSYISFLLCRHVQMVWCLITMGSEVLLSWGDMWLQINTKVTLTIRFIAWWNTSVLTGWSRKLLHTCISHECITLKLFDKYILYAMVFPVIPISILQLNWGNIVN